MVINLVSCSTQLSMKLIVFLTFMSRINDLLLVSDNKPKNFIDFGYVNIYEPFTELSMKNVFYNLHTWNQT